MVLTLVLNLMMVVTYAQDDTDARVKDLKQEISRVVQSEQSILQQKLDSINARVARKQISDAEARALRQEAETEFASRVAENTAPLQEELDSILEERTEPETTDDMPEDEYGDEQYSEDENMKDHHDRPYLGDIGRPWEWGKHKKKRSERRTTSQFVFAFGLNNAITGDDLESLDNNGLSVSNSRFYEWGLSWKTRLLKDSPLLNVKYGLSFMINNLRPSDNTYFQKNGNITELAVHPNTLIKDPYFRSVNLVLPLHLELDFSKKKMRDDKPVIRTQRGFRLGAGGYAGINTSTKQILSYRLNGLTTREETRGDYNTRKFIYGISGYVGYKDISLYSKLDLNTLFDYGHRGRHNISFGVRFDFK